MPLDSTESAAVRLARSARVAYDAAGGDYAKAVDELLRVADPDMTAELARRGAYAAVAAMRSDDRQTVRKAVHAPVQHQPARGLEAIKAGNVAIRKALFSVWRLSSGLPLGEATRADLEREAMAEGAMARGHMRNVRFYAALAAAIPGDGVLSQHVTEEAAADILRSADND